MTCTKQMRGHVPGTAAASIAEGGGAISKPLILLLQENIVSSNR